MSSANGQQPSPAKGRSRGKGRNGPKAAAARAGIKKTGNGRRGRQKLYGSLIAQAAAERMKELKASFSAVAAAVAPALDDFAQRTLDFMKSDARSHEIVPEHQEVIAFLNTRHKATINRITKKTKADVKVVKANLELNQRVARQSFLVSRRTLSRCCVVIVLTPP
jgi:hypothetical protein